MNPTEVQVHQCVRSTSADSRRVLLQPAYVLHHRAYRDTSRILELLTRDYGRVTLFVRGARGGRFGLSAVLQPFNAILVSWLMGREAGQLTGAELMSTPHALPAARLMSGFYLNELLLKLLTGHDNQPGLYDLYVTTLTALQTQQNEPQTLRLFEKRLLQELGYGLLLTHEKNGTPVVGHQHYGYFLEQGVRAVDAGNVPLGCAGVFTGASLLALAHEQLNDPVNRQDARRLLRAALEHLLDGRKLHSRAILTALRSLEQPC